MLQLRLQRFEKWLMLVRIRHVQPIYGNPRAPQRRALQTSQTKVAYLVLCDNGLCFAYGSWFQALCALFGLKPHARCP